MSKTPSSLFQDSHIQHPIEDLELPFTDYIAACKQLISQTRLDLNSTHAEQIIQANTPFELRPKEPAKYGALLIHGLLDSPFTLHDMGLTLQSQGLLTRAILLPGHGTVPGDLLHIDYHQWVQAVQYGVASFSKEVDQLFLVGYSTGASLALYHALQNTKGIAGLILLAPAIKINSAFAGMAHWSRAVDRIWSRAAWFHRDAQEMLDYAKYLSIPFNAIYQVYCLTQVIKKAAPLDLPLFFALAQQDNTVCSQASLRYFQQQPNPRNHMLIYTNQPSLTVDPRITQRHSAYPLLRIRDFSHLALPFSPENYHYGERGDYPLASLIEKEDQTLYGEFTPLQIQFNEWLFNLKLSKHHYKRLTFNPDFDFLIRLIVKWSQDSILPL